MILFLFKYNVHTKKCTNSINLYKINTLVMKLKSENHISEHGTLDGAPSIHFSLPRGQDPNSSNSSD